VTNAKGEISDLLEIVDGARRVLGTSSRIVVATGNYESALAENYSDSRTRE